MDKVSAIALRVARFGAAAVRVVDLLLDGHTDPGQRHGQQEITDRDKYGQHRPLPQCATIALCALFAALLQAARGRCCDEKRSWRYGISTGLTSPATALNIGAMLQHNTATSTGRKAHLAHAAVVSLHALCCGLPALALASAAAGAATSAALIADFVGPFHAFLHQHELWVLAVSGLLVTLGAALEAWARIRPHSHTFPWLFAFSVVCFLANAAIIAAHRTWG